MTVNMLPEASSDAFEFSCPIAFLICVLTNARSDENSRVARPSTFYLPCISLCGMLSSSVYYVMVCFIDADVVHMMCALYILTTSDLPPVSLCTVPHHRSTKQRYIAPSWLVYIYPSMC